MSGGSRKFNIITILKEVVTNNYVVTNLRKFTKYEFFLMPFYRSIEGQPSNSRQVVCTRAAELKVYRMFLLGVQRTKHCEDLWDQRWMQCLCGQTGLKQGCINYNRNVLSRLGPIAWLSSILTSRALARPTPF